MAPKALKIPTVLMSWQSCPVGLLLLYIDPNLSNHPNHLNQPNHLNHPNHPNCPNHLNHPNHSDCPNQGNNLPR